MFAVKYPASFNRCVNGRIPGGSARCASCVDAYAEQHSTPGILGCNQRFPDHAVRFGAFWVAQQWRLLWIHETAVLELEYLAEVLILSRHL